jgi:RNA polymerase sigma-70 factor (ECF subfamily)
MIRAWRASSSFEGRSSLRSWLFRIATNVCLDMHRSVQRRARPMEMGPASAPDESRLGPLMPEAHWVTPIADAKIQPESADPGEVTAYRDSVRLAFITALQHLQPRQRAALILCEVLGWQAAEAAGLLETTVAAVNSSLQRARATLASLEPSPARDRLSPAHEELLVRYVEAFEKYDIDSFVQLLHEDAVQSMPPFPMWLQGARHIGDFMLLPGPSACRGSRLVPLHANGCPAFAQYKPDPAGGFATWAIQVLEFAGGKVAELSLFLVLLDPVRLFESFGLPSHLD